jgi:O-antigen chain-terminating methyltransferase
MSPTREQLLAAHARLPEPYQPAWGLAESASKARRHCEDRFAIVRDAVVALPADRPLRILDVGCAQGYFSLGLKSELQDRGIDAEVTGVDSLEDNVRFCRELAEHHRLGVRFLHDRFDGGFFGRHELADFDAVLALNVLHHIRELEGGAVADATIKATRDHSTVLLCEIAQPEEALDWVADWHASDDSLLRDFAFRRKLGTFGTHLTEVLRPLYVCSNRLAYVGGRWFAFEHVLDRAHPGVPDRFAGQRRFFMGPGVLVKSARTTGDFGDFNRAELEVEAQVLDSLGDEPSRYPPLLARSGDGEEAWLVRGALPGVLVSELIANGTAFDRNALVHALLGELAHLESRGYRHADLRLWNMLWHDGALRLIDFGSMTRESSPLHRVALAAVLAELSRGEISGAQPWYTAVHPLSVYPRTWHGLIRYLLGCAQPQFSFAEAHRILQQQPENSAGSLGVTVCTEILAACAAAQVEGFVRLQQHADNVEASFEQAREHAESLAESLQASSRSLAEAGRYAASLEAQIERETAATEAERNAAQSALAEAADYAATLETERQQLKAQVRQLDRMRRRFRLLKPLWPHEDEDRK